METRTESATAVKTGGVYDAIGPTVLVQGAPALPRWTAEAAEMGGSGLAKLPPDLKAAIAAAAAREAPVTPPTRGAGPERTGGNTDGAPARQSPPVDDAGEALAGADRPAASTAVRPELVAYQADSPAVRLSATIGKDLPAGGVLAGARVTLGGVKDGRAEQLLYDLTGTRIIAKHSVDAAGDALIISFERPDTAANYRHVLSSLRYLNRAEETTDGPRLAVIEGIDESGGGFVIGAVAVMVGAASAQDAAAGPDMPRAGGDSAFAFLCEGADGDEDRSAPGGDPLSAGDPAPTAGALVYAEAAAGARASGALETARSTLHPDSAAGGEGRHPAEEDDGVFVYRPDGAVALGGPHDVLGDIAGTRLLGIRDPELPDGPGVYQVFEPPAGDGGAAGRDANWLEAFGLTGEGRLFGNSDDRPLDAAPAQAAAPRFESLLLSPLPSEDDIADGGGQAGAA